MGEVINLRRFKKTKRRDEAHQKAEANRAKFGRSKAEKDITEARAGKEERDLDGHKRET